MARATYGVEFLETATAAERDALVARIADAADPSSRRIVAILHSIIRGAAKRIRPISLKWLMGHIQYCSPSLT
jgi:hypothetical protein